MRVAQPIVLQEEDRLKLYRQSRGRSLPARVVLRSRIVLMAAAGQMNKQIAASLKVAPRMVALWRGRFLAQGVDSLLKDATRPGRKPTISAEMTATLIEKTTQGKPANATHWSTRTMAKEMSISKASVSRIWRAHGLKPHRVDSFKISNDPQFAEKLEDIVGLYLDPPEHAVVLSLDEKTQIQALDRTQPSLPMKTGQGVTMTSDYKRNGTTTLFAALNIANGKVYGQCEQKHRHQEWLKFLVNIDETVPQEKEIHIICDNYATHKHAKVKSWLELHPRFHVHFTPTSSSWLNMVERFFRDLTQNYIRRGIFKDLEQLIMGIGDYLDSHNKKPKPFIWTAKASDILAKVSRAKIALNKRLSA